MLDESRTLDECFRPLNEAELKHAPSKVYIMGDPSLLVTGVRVSLIGSRNPSKSGQARARRLSALLVQRGICIVSGLATGIDTEVHRTTIERGGRTIGVLGNPIDVFYPRENQALQTAIGQEHLLISQFAPGTPSHRGCFPARNRLMALLSDVTVIIEANDGSGTMHQARESLRLDRPLWIMHSAVSNTSLKWPQELLNSGARVLSDDSMQDLGGYLSFLEKSRL